MQHPKIIEFDLSFGTLGSKDKQLTEVTERIIWCETFFIAEEGDFCNLFCLQKTPNNANYHQWGQFGNDFFQEGISTDNS